MPDEPKKIRRREADEIVAPYVIAYNILMAIIIIAILLWVYWFREYS
jgi:hypothetical protein